MLQSQVMDADLSHPPDRIPNMVELIAKGKADFVLGSRYTEGFWVENWTLARRIISLGATTLAKPLISSSVTDPMSGFFAIRRSPSPLLSLPLILHLKGTHFSSFCSPFLFSAGTPSRNAENSIPWASKSGLN